MATMNVSVPDRMRDWVQDQVDGGRYTSASDYVRDLIRRDQAATDGENRWLEAVDAAVDCGLADAQAGRISDADAVFDRLESRYRAGAEPHGAT